MIKLLTPLLLIFGCSQSPSKRYSYDDYNIIHPIESQVEQQSYRSRVRNRLMVYYDDFVNCFTKNYKKYSESGTIVMVYEIMPSGDVKRVGVKQSRLNLKQKACLIKTVYDIKFPAHSGDVKVKFEQPLSF